MRTQILSRALSTLALLSTCAGSVQATDQEPTQLAARKIYVAANGVDTSPCGRPGSPCRSISHGLLNAASGDTVLVGPGRYGDLNGDGALGGDGEETCGGFVGCVVRIDRDVSVLSTHGAAASVIDASQMSVAAIPVFITAPRSRFGAWGRGFLVKAQPNNFGLYVLTVSDVTVAGNIVTNASTGFMSDGGRNLLQHNFAYQNIVGYEIRGASTVRSNVATGNVLGFTVYLTGATLSGNTASVNDHTGFAIAPSGRNILLNRNVATGNRTAGFRIDRGGSAVITRNNIFGNFFCGFLNDSGRRIDATQNYWGSVSGPGSDPADVVCDHDINSTTVSTPHSPRPMPVPRPF